MRGTEVHSLRSRAVFYFVVLMLIGINNLIGAHWSARSQFLANIVLILILALSVLYLIVTSIQSRRTHDARQQQEQARQDILYTTIAEKILGGRAESRRRALAECPRVGLGRESGRSFRKVPGLREGPYTTAIRS